MIDNALHRSSAYVGIGLDLFTDLNQRAGYYRPQPFRTAMQWTEPCRDLVRLSMKQGNPPNTTLAYHSTPRRSDSTLSTLEGNGCTSSGGRMPIEADSEGLPNVDVRRDARSHMLLSR
jgi:hypothetical protein